MNLALAFGNTEIGFTGGADKEFVILALLKFFLIHSEVLANGAEPLQIMEIFQISLLDFAAENTVGCPYNQQV